MLNLVKARLKHGYQAIPNPLKAQMNAAFPGVPTLQPKADLSALKALCPAGAFSSEGLDMGLCVFCGLCERQYPDYVKFNPDFRLAADAREKLLLRPGQSDYCETATASRLPQRFRRSFALRNVCAGGCNACELELGACSNVNFDMGRYGLEVVASPRHADALILTGPISKNMAAALIDTYKAIANPKFVILSGACAISGGLFANSPAVERGWLDTIAPVLYVPGCPAHPLSIIHGLATLMGKR